MKNLHSLTKKSTIILGQLGVLAYLNTANAFAAQHKSNNITIQINPEDVQNAAPISTTMGQVIAFIVSAAVVFGIIAALLFVVLGAFQWITSGGDKGKVESARNHIVAAIVGLIIIVLSLVIVNFVLQLLGLGGLATGLTIKGLIPR